MTADNIVTVVVMRPDGRVMIRVFIIYLSLVVFGAWAMPLSPKMIECFYAASICSLRTACRPKFDDVFDIRLNRARRSWVSSAE